MLLRLLALLLAALCLGARPTSATSCAGISERAVLEALYFSTSGPSWSHGNGWLVLQDYCEWEGVYCDVDGHVTGLWLPSFGLTGKLPDDLACLPYIEFLSVENNNLVTRFPEAICQASNLFHINMDNANVVGPLPDCVCNMPSLRTLSVSGSHLTGLLPQCLGSAGTPLEAFRAECSHIEGTVPQGLLDGSVSDVQLDCNPNLVCPDNDLISPSTFFSCGAAGCADQCLSESVASSCDAVLTVPGCGPYYLEPLDCDSLTVSGYVTDEVDATGVSGVTVSVYPVDSLSLLGSDDTNQDGAFSVDITKYARTYDHLRLVFEEDSHVPRHMVVASVSCGPVYVSTTLTSMSCVSPLSVTALDSAGAPVEGLTIGVLTSQASDPILDITDTNGRAEFQVATDATESEVTAVTWSGAGYQSGLSPVYLTCGIEHQMVIEVSCQSPSVSMSVVTTGIEPHSLSGVTVVLSAQDGTSVSSVSDETGVAIFPDLPSDISGAEVSVTLEDAGSYSLSSAISFTAPNCGDVVFPVSVDCSLQTLCLAVVDTLSDSVETIEGIVVSLTDSTEHGMGSVTSTSGYTCLNVSQSDNGGDVASVLASYSFGGIEYAKVIEMGCGETQVTLEVACAHMLAGTVLDGSGAPLAGIHVYAANDADINTTTDDDGHYVLLGALPAATGVVFEPPASSGYSALTLHPSVPVCGVAVFDTVLPCEAENTLSVTVLDPSGAPASDVEVTVVSDGESQTETTTESGVVSFSSMEVGDAVITWDSPTYTSDVRVVSIQCGSNHEYVSLTPCDAISDTPCTSQTLCYTVSSECGVDLPTAIVGAHVSLYSPSSDDAIHTGVSAATEVCFEVPSINGHLSSVRAEYKTDVHEYTDTIYLGCGVHSLCLEAGPLDSQVCSVSGQVVDKMGHPVSGAEVSLNNVAAHTNSAGLFDLYGVESGRGQICVTAKEGVCGYLDTPVFVPETGLHNMRLTVPCFAAPSRSLAFIDVCGSGVDGLEVTATTLEGTSITVVSGPDGLVEFSWESLLTDAVTYSWGGDSTIYEWGSVTEPLTCGSSRIVQYPVTLQCATDRSIEVGISLANPFSAVNPPEGVSVQWTTETAASTTATNAAGIATFDALPPVDTEFSLSVDSVPDAMGHYDPHVFGTHSLSCCGSISTSTVLECKGQSVGVTLGHGDYLYSGLVVRFYNPMTGEEIGVTETTGDAESTEYVTLETPLSTVAVSYTHVGAPYDHYETIGCGHTLLSYEECIRVVSGSIVDSDSGDALVGVAVAAHGHGTVQDTTTEGGFFLLNLDEGDYTITFHMDGYQPKTIHVTIAMCIDRGIDIALVPDMAFCSTQRVGIMLGSGDTLYGGLDEVGVTETGLADSTQFLTLNPPLNVIGISYTNTDGTYDHVVPLPCGITTLSYDVCIRTVSGTVSAAGATTPTLLGGVTVSVDGSDLDTSLEDGTYLVNMDEGPYTITYSRDGYVTQTVEGTMGDCGDVSLDVELEPMAMDVCGTQRVGVILSSEDTGDANYSDILVHYYDSTTGSEIGTTVTTLRPEDAQLLTVPSPLPDVGISYTHEGAPYDHTLSLSCGDNLVTFSECIRVVSGVVCDDDGQPLAGVSVTVSGGDGVSDVSSGDGFYLLNLPIGASTLDYTRFGYTPQSQLLTLDECDSLTVNLSLVPDPLTHCDDQYVSVSLVSDYGSPYAGIAVSLYDVASGALVGTTQTGELVETLLVPIDPQVRDMGISYTDHGLPYDHVERLECGYNAFEYVECVRIVNGVVKDAVTGEPLVGASVTLDDDHSVSDVTSESGFYLLNVPEGWLPLTASMTGYVGQTVYVTVSECNDVMTDILMVRLE
ncbi:hypothetical protein KIPB_000573 [Kipferlia bialata]|uniref:Uncharacterized protein n=1 Tax=Kipferlia bialata TaxID=797122 RepID=A0A9K3CPA8_9EUKA|nr:hypothetical protein KIPB_000573 [Kipferlia bialata]|eukprot:g573.t1